MLDFTPNWRGSTDFERARRSLESETAAIAQGEELVFNTFERQSKACLGRIDLHSCDFGVPRCAIGYMADAWLCGDGLVFEATSTCTALEFSHGAVRVHALIDARKTRSIGFAKSMGLGEEGVLRAYGRYTVGALHDELVLCDLSLPDPSSGALNSKGSP